MKSVLDFQKMRTQGKKISMITCYDYTSARMVAASNIDCILVGDSLAMTMLGHDSTLPATPEIMAMHVESVRRGCKDKFIVGDMPFLAHRGSLDRTLEAVGQIMRAGAHALKIEGIDGSKDVIRHIVQSGVPVMGHLGLTPQSVHQMGGYRVQATETDTAAALIKQAQEVEEAGAFAVVLECVPAALAAEITSTLSIPTIGIGAGHDCAGQVLVFQDLLGFNTEFKPRFVRSYLNGFETVTKALNHYDHDVKTGEFPIKEESY